MCLGDQFVGSCIGLVSGLEASNISQIKLRTLEVSNRGYIARYIVVLDT
jgi:hypothetical protein